AVTTSLSYPVTSPPHCFINPTAPSTTLRSLYSSAPTPGGRPPARPLRFLAAISLDSSGITAAMPRSRRYARFTRDVYPRSASNASGRVRACPHPILGTRISPRTSCNIAPSWRCPPVATIDSGRPCPSTAKSTFVLNPLPPPSHLPPATTLASARPPPSTAKCPLVLNPPRALPIP